ncbi:MAG: cytochrome c peroxidase [Candidatus Thiodiazotropha sp.]
MNNRYRWKVQLAGFAMLSLAAGMANALTPMEKLGKKIYFDTNLSNPDGQACVSCHHPGLAFIDPDSNIPVSEGVIPGQFGGRNAPSAGYAMFAPPLYEAEPQFWIGGQFWDGRATGNPALDAIPGTLPDSLGDPLADQARGPFLNPVEMHNANIVEVLIDIRDSSYAKRFKEVTGINLAAIPLDPGAEPGQEALDAYDAMALAIAAFERSTLFATFSSKYDVYLQACLASGGDKDECALGEGPVADAVASSEFTALEKQGMNLFMGEAQCVACHVVDWTDPAAAGGLEVQVPNWSPDGTVPPMFTDFTYDNLGVPVNPEIAALIGEPQDIDRGLGITVDDPSLDGLFKVMSLRNIGISGPYAHNGYFKSLEAITHFYNTADVGAPGNPVQFRCEDLGLADASAAQALANDCWPMIEVGDPNRDELGNLGLTPQEESAVAAFMRTLTDGFEM